MKTKLLSVVMTILMMAGFVQAQKGWAGSTYQQFYIPAGSAATGFPIITTAVPEGSIVGYMGSGIIPPSEYRGLIVLFYVPEPRPTATEEHYFISGICSEIETPEGWRRIRFWRNLYYVTQPDGTFNTTDEHCIYELVPKKGNG
jgi:hypothetical protein